MRQALIGFLTLALFALAEMSSAQNAEIGAEETAIAWEGAQVFVPGGLFKPTPDKVAVNEPLPVFIYLYGAIGMDPEHAVLWVSFIRGLGYIAVLPDRMARPGRKPNYDSKTKRGGGLCSSLAARSWWRR
jgi:hypothetical protein